MFKVFSVKQQMLKITNADIIKIAINSLWTNVKILLSRFKTNESLRKTFKNIKKKLKLFIKDIKEIKKQHVVKDVVVVSKNKDNVINYIFAKNLNILTTISIFMFCLKIFK